MSVEKQSYGAMSVEKQSYGADRMCRLGSGSVCGLRECVQAETPEDSVEIPESGDWIRSHKQPTP